MAHKVVESVNEYLGMVSMWICLPLEDEVKDVHHVDQLQLEGRDAEEKRRNEDVNESMNQKGGVHEDQVEVSVKWSHFIEVSKFGSHIWGVELRIVLPQEVNHHQGNGQGTNSHGHGHVLLVWLLEL